MVIFQILCWKIYMQICLQIKFYLLIRLKKIRNLIITPMTSEINFIFILKMLVPIKDHSSQPNKLN